jgi:hypothetical protein
MAGREESPPTCDNSSFVLPPADDCFSSTGICCVVVGSPLVGSSRASTRIFCPYLSPFHLTVTVLVVDIGTEWTLNASLTILSSYRKCSKRRMLSRSEQATSLLPIGGTHEEMLAHSPWFRLWERYGVCCRTEFPVLQLGEIES